MKSEYDGPFSDSEFDTIKRKVSAYIGKGVFAQRDREDLIQECCVHWVDKRGQYQIGKASLKTFQERVLDHKLRDLVAREQTAKRMGSHSALSLDETLGDEADNWTRADEVTCDPWKEPSDAFSQADLALDLAEVRKKLSPEQEELCRLLGEENLTITEISERLKNPRSTIYDEKRRIQQLFEEGNIKDYL